MRKLLKNKTQNLSTSTSFINQKAYGKLEVNNTEMDMVQIWNHSKFKEDNQVVFVEREKLGRLIEVLKECEKTEFIK